MEYRFIMTDSVRRLLLGDLTSKLTSLVNLWPKRDRRYGELQGAINKVLVDYNVAAGSDSIYMTRRDAALTSLVLIPIRLCNLDTAAGKSDALSSLKQALNLFDPTILPPVHVQFSYEIIQYNAGRVYRDSRKYAEAAKSFDYAATAWDASVLGKIQDSIARVGVETCHNDQPRNMQLCIDLWTQGVTEAKELGSELCIQEARECYNLLCAAWPREDAIQKLHQHL